MKHKDGIKINFEYPISKLPADISKNKTLKYKYPHIHVLSRSEREEDQGIIYLKEKKDIFNNKKIIITFNDTKLNPPLYPFIDLNNKYGTTQRTVMMVGEDKNLKIIKNFLNSKIILFLIKITQYSSGMYKQNEYKILNQMIISNKLTQNSTDQEIYSIYNISIDEQKFIEEILKEPVKSDKNTKKANKLINNNQSSKNTKKKKK